MLLTLKSVRFIHIQSRQRKIKYFDSKFSSYQCISHYCIMFCDFSFFQTSLIITCTFYSGCLAVVKIVVSGISIFSGRTYQTYNLFESFGQSDIDGNLSQYSLQPMNIKQTVITDLELQLPTLFYKSHFSIDL